MCAMNNFFSLKNKTKKFVDLIKIIYRKYQQTTTKAHTEKEVRIQGKRL